ncbi:MAG: bifunctional [glutamate--ammonia ligase]-adenylyl-L-tyrosine phosphorylase/[glutamate--ammonia-ligase] adenylyltransferase [Deltaproteobacteria bacterium]|nr:bifunctional [glutamate--ammonia ligase]-adenylyl-L-tyrosine phosphorylase/[glutamate--ammonia-ligase] adenylyltransferase [Deltaproteobacteria bacterium]MBT6498374.1 bifunctional [glutamate--ammonia ligase]-adenylyl-L-tyrosine phosphorylase/[glutamate--ammonia-ligase] adenylyltransferase [Deltaproteobacteria bacterium]MBT6611839.1 bifunctional [glutamate--ammonia ligase]-adenylyl-L-tyrosine phosphorylase/[glutamate--ammonia-ligase] adenylyltransferase [Deltaproteobacteria bacterium]MBT715146
MNRTAIVPDILRETCDERLNLVLKALEETGLDQSLIAEHTAFLERALLFSEFIFKSLMLKPTLLCDLVESGDLLRSYAAGTYETDIEAVLETVTAESEMGLALRWKRVREMLRIAWRDINSLASLDETLANLSDFAEACVDKTFKKLYDWQCLKMGTPVGGDGTPLKIVVLGMGKLGARELNFSSDIDLIFAFPEAGYTVEGPKSVSNEEFFIRLCRAFLKVMNEKGPEGFLFRVDMRLRPFGDAGPLTMSFNALEDYYQSQGREWERYAMIKAKTIAGDKTAGKDLLQRLRPFIYRRYLDYGVYDSLREMKTKIATELERKKLEDNIKIGAGGIREIEFFGQIFQLVRGGVEAYLQERSILKVLSVLARENYITPAVCSELTEAYRFLRLAENRLQEYSDQQMHELPKDEKERIRLAASLGYDDWDSFYRQLTFHTEKVHFHFNDLLSQEEESNGTDLTEADLSEVWLGQADTEEIEKTMTAAGYNEIDEVVRCLNWLREDSATLRLSPKGRDWLDKLIPIVLKKVGKSEQPETALLRIFELIQAIEQRTSYISMLLENPDALTHLVRLSNASPWIITFLARHPLLLDELLDVNTLYKPPVKEDLEKSLRRRLNQIPEDDLEKQLEELIIFKNVNVFQVAAAEIAGAFQLMKVSDYLSDTAETVLSQTFGLSWDFLVNKYGEPVAELDGERCELGFLIVAYGKLGGLELSYGSDLDLVFLNAAVDGETAGGELTIGNSEFYVRLGQRIVHLLTANTRAGRLYEIDMRLRPNGSSGILVSNLESFKEYQQEKAWTWEHQALIRSRPICGDGRMFTRYLEIKKEIITQPRDPESLKEDIRSMRVRMRKELEKPQEGIFDIKQGRGGIIDIEFIVQYLSLLHAYEFEELARWPDNVRLIGTLNKTRIIENEVANALRGAYLTYRSEVHRLNLQEKAAFVPEDTFDGMQHKIAEIWDSIF